MKWVILELVYNVTQNIKVTLKLDKLACSTKKDMKKWLENINLQKEMFLVIIITIKKIRSFKKSCD